VLGHSRSERFHASYPTSILQNYRTELEYEYGLTRKLAAFTMIVAYFALYFLAAVYVPFSGTISSVVSAIVPRARHVVVGPERIAHHLSTLLVTGQLLSFFREVGARATPWMD